MLKWKDVSKKLPLVEGDFLAWGCVLEPGFSPQYHVFEVSFDPMCGWKCSFNPTLSIEVGFWTNLPNLPNDF